MPVNKITDNVWSVGVLNPNLRVFDIIMKTEYGTSYNAYLVKGTEKTALIETVHFNFFDEYIDNVKSIVDISTIDYVILNHNEPDHSGSLVKILELNPNITVITSIAGNKYLQAIVNGSYNSKIVKNGDNIDLGGKFLTFIPAPFLHWPDSMFTYLSEDKIIFTCDFLGCHYTEPRVFDNKIIYQDYYDDAFQYYYKAIFGPFKEYVLAGLDKLEKLDFHTVCPSHGPVLVENVSECIAKYRRWSQIKKNDPKKVLIFYVSAYGYTRKMASAIYDVIIAKGYDVEILDVINNDFSSIMEKIENADALMIGSPTINRDALKPIWDVLSAIDPISNKGKPVGVFGSYGWSGEAVNMIIQRLNSLKLNVFGSGIRVNFLPDEENIALIKDYAVNFIEEML